MGSKKRVESFVPSSDKIPQIIIQTWKNDNVPIKYKNMVESIRGLNPHFEYKFFTDNDIDIFLQTNYPDYYRTYLALPITIQKIDFFRYIAVYHYGGFYFDLDMNGLQPLDETVLNNDCVFPVDEMINTDMCNQQRYVHFCKNDMFFLLGQYAFAAKPKHPFIKLLIDSIHVNIGQILQQHNVSPNKELYVYSTTGPDFVSKLYMDYLNKPNIKILHNNTRQYFGKYAQHNYFGTWKA
jgi:mannosyltransferase OCH1-like enzyme